MDSITKAYAAAERIDAALRVEQERHARLLAELDRLMRLNAIREAL